MKRLSFTVIIAALFLLSSCGRGNRELTLGTAVGGVYANEFFGFSITFPQNYYIKTNQEIAQMIGVPLADLTDSAALANIRALPLFTAHQQNPNAVTSGGYNPRLAITAERVEQIVTEKTYLTELLGYLTSPYLRYDEITYSQFGGRQFYILTTTENTYYNGTLIMSSTSVYHATRLRGYIVMFVFTDFDNDLTNTLLRSLIIE